MIINGSDVKNIIINGNNILKINLNDSLLYETSRFNSSLVDAWFMSGLKNEDTPAFIEGINTSTFYPADFTKIYGIRDDVTPTVITLASRSAILNSGPMEPGTTYTTPSYRVEIKGNIDNSWIGIGYEIPMMLGYLLEVTEDGIYTVPSFTFEYTENMPLWVTTVQHTAQYDGVTITMLPNVVTNKLITNNFAWSDMSGFGGYNCNIRKWTSIEGRCEKYIQEGHKHTCINITNNFLESLSYCVASNFAIIGAEIIVKITGIPEGGEVIIGQIGYIRTNKDGIYKGAYAYDNNGNTTIRTVNCKGATIIVEFLPVYPGALVFDGIDDNLSFDNKIGAIKTLLIRFIPLVRNTIIYDQRSGINPPFYFALYTESQHPAYNRRNTDGKTYINGELNTIIADTFLNKDHIVALTNINGVMGMTHIGASNFNSFYSKMALQWVALYTDVLTKEDIIAESNKMDKEYNRRLLL